MRLTLFGVPVYLKDKPFLSVPPHRTQKTIRVNRLALFWSFPGLQTTQHRTFYPKRPHYIISHQPFIHRWNSHRGQRHLNTQLQQELEIEPPSSGPTLPPEPQPTFFICCDVGTGESLLPQSCQQAIVYNIKVCSCIRISLSWINSFEFTCISSNIKLYPACTALNRT